MGLGQKGICHQICSSCCPRWSSDWLTMRVDPRGSCRCVSGKDSIVLGWIDRPFASADWNRRRRRPQLLVELQSRRRLEDLSTADVTETATTVVADDDAMVRVVKSFNSLDRTNDFRLHPMPPMTIRDPSSQVQFELNASRARQWTVTQPTVELFRRIKWHFVMDFSAPLRINNENWVGSDGGFWGKGI